MGEHGRGRAEQGPAQLIGVDLHRPGRSLELGQVVDELDQALDVVARQPAGSSVRLRRLPSAGQGISRTRPKACRLSM